METKHPTLANLKISTAMGDYLAEIYRVGYGRMWVSTTTVADQLGVSGAATVRMVRRLKEVGLVEHIPYKGVRLSKKGLLAALLNVRRHRLAERFLVDVLDLDWADVHEHGEIFQRGISPLIEAQIDAMMRFPKTCPHGEPIPSMDGELPEMSDRPLTVVPAGLSGIISRIRIREPEKLRYLAEIDMVPGTKFTLISRSPFNGPLQLQLADREQIVGGELAAALWVDCNFDCNELL